MIMTKREQYQRKSMQMRRDGWGYDEIIKYWGVRAKKAEMFKAAAKMLEEAAIKWEDESVSCCGDDIDPTNEDNICPTCFEHC